MAGLTSASAATYLVNKALITGSGNAPSINQIVPSPTRPGAQVVVYGTSFTAPGSSTVNRPQIAVGGALCPTTDSTPTPDHATIRLPAVVALGQVPVTLTTPAGLTTSPPTQLTVVADSMVIAMVGHINAKPNGIFTLYGQGFYDAESVDGSGNPISNNEPPADVFLTQQQVAGAQPQKCTVQPGATDNQMRVTIPGDILPAGAAATFFDVSAKRGDLPATLPPNGLAVQITP